MSVDPKMPSAFTNEAVAVDAGLRAYMLKIYNLMAMALSVTGLVAYLMSTSQELMQFVFGSPLSILFMLAPIGIALFIGFRLHAISEPTARVLFWVYSAVMGISLSGIFLIYTGTSIARTFFVTASTFAAMSLWGYTTKKDLTSMGSFLMMGLIGIIIAALVNFFLKSSALAFAISVLGVLIFTGLTAYDTQKIKWSYYEGDNDVTASKKAIIGALTLYLDFINLFLHLLRFLGDRRS
jgi:FtsH-binding integral membrane protein